MGRVSPNSHTNPFMNEFRVALRHVPAFATVTGPAHTFATVPASLFPNNRVLFRTIFHSPCYYTYALVLYCCALYSLGREINNIPSVKPQGEKAPWRINAMWGYSWIRLEFKMGCAQTPPCLHGRAFLPGNYTGESQTDAHTHRGIHTQLVLWG